MSELTREELDARLGTIESRIDTRFAEADAKVEKRFAEADMRAEKRFAEADAKLERRIGDVIKWTVGLAIAIIAVQVAALGILVNALSARPPAPIVITAPPPAQPGRIQ